MTKNPLFNSLAAIAYISAVSSLMYYGSAYSGPVKSVIAPIALLSLFSLSAAVMGYVFCYEPFQLYMDGKKKESVDLFLKTVLIFGGLTGLLLLLLFSGLFF